MGAPGARPRSTVHASCAIVRHVLPGVRPDVRQSKPIALASPWGSADTMSCHAVPTRAARNTAMTEALADLPPMIISDLFGIQPRTAEGELAE
ncbi:hypothetical protein GCM10011583_60360 [Streptomyces camponoticapitis]|uniref:Uncharacterized protein n=1 Tax=Streptomyces camponoticapitis TaxID=1616125 RepID=A0ABQ2ESS4_9ACTN|nr:hypothetical protein GCM10011583_60360 [Streptomyces camponoticapitis]